MGIVNRAAHLTNHFQVIHISALVTNSGPVWCGTLFGRSTLVVADGVRAYKNLEGSPFPQLQYLEPNELQFS